MPEVATLPAASRGYAAPRSILIPLESGGPMPEMTVSAIAAALAVAIAGTTVSGVYTPVVRVQDVAQMAPVGAQAFVVGEMLRAIRRRTALTWEQLGSIFAVSRRSLHHWANGQTVSPENQFKVRRLHDMVSALAEMPAFAARSKVLSNYGLATAAENAPTDGSPLMVADQTPIAAKVSVRRSPRTRVR